ncbi:MAG TPA: hypothetical protein VIL65_16045 [Beijerinckiaceae bacterium]|jgi:hypothetical protein
MRVIDTARFAPERHWLDVLWVRLRPRPRSAREASLDGLSDYILRDIGVLDREMP